jgi:hypothetical protein
VIDQLSGFPSLYGTNFHRFPRLINSIDTLLARAGAPAVLQAIDERRSAVVLAMG